MTTEAPNDSLRCAEHGRPTRLTCVTCGRPLCPDCLVQTPVGFKCADDARGAKVILVRFLPARPVRAAGSMVLWVAPLFVLLVLRLVFGFGAGLGASSVIGSLIFSLLISIGLTIAIRYFMMRRF